MIKEAFPIQPLILDHEGTRRFKANAIVKCILAAGPLDLNDIACMQFSTEDREQFAQLIGYSISGYADLSEVTDETYERVMLKSKQVFGD